SASGSYAEQVLVDADHALPVPDEVELTTAAAVPLQGMTAQMLTDGVVSLEPGQTVLLTAGAGGVGLLLTQLATAAGARVITTVSTSEKEELSRQAGAWAVIRYDQMGNLTEELPAQVRELTGGVGVDVAYDGVGKATFDACLASVRPRGMLVLFGGASGQVPPFDLQRLNTAGSLFVTRPTLFHYIADPEERRLRAGTVFAAVRTGALNVRIGAQYPLTEAAEAHRALENRKTTGKVLLIPCVCANVWLWSPSGPIGDHNHTFAAKGAAGQARSSAPNLSAARARMRSRTSAVSAAFRVRSAARMRRENASDLRPWPRASEA